MSAALRNRGRPTSGRRRLILILVLLLAYAAIELWPRITGGAGNAVDAGDAAVEAAFDARASDRMLEFDGVVERLLADDLQGSRHQKFIVRLASRRTLLVSHNIDLARRVPIGVGDRVQISGQYEWNERGGIVHWTHHDPDGRRPGGWIQHRGQRYD